MTPGPLATTAIGSLPHLEPEPGIAAAFRLDIPCLPTLPRRAATEQLVPQGLAGLPGLAVDALGNCTVDVERWRKGRLDFQRALRRAIDDPSPTSTAIPTPESLSAWRPFLREIAARRVPLVKLQLVGPLTATRAAASSDGRPLTADLPVSNQVYQLLVARALAMIRAVQDLGARPLFFFDEPGLAGLSLGAARNLMALKELRVAVVALRRTGALTGLHCCGEAQWERILPLGFNLLSIDTALSLPSLLRRRDELAAFARGGGRLALGAVPTGSQALPDPGELADAIGRVLSDGGHLALLRTALLTPACGLATRTVPESDAILEALPKLQSALARRAALA